MKSNRDSNQSSQDVNELEDSITSKIIPSTRTFEILKKSFDFLSTPFQILSDKDGNLVDISELLDENPDMDLIELFNLVKSDYEFVIPNNSEEGILSRVIITYAIDLQNKWGQDSDEDPIYWIYNKYFADEGSVLRSITDMNEMSFVNYYYDRANSYEHSSRNVDALYTDIINSYDIISEARMPTEETIPHLTEDEIKEAWYRIDPNQDPNTPLTIEDVIRGIESGLHVVNSDPVNTDYKIAGDLSFKIPEDEEALVGPEISSLVEFSKWIEDPNVDTVSGHVITSNYPHLGYISKYISPRSNGRYMYEYMQTSRNMPMIVYTDNQGQRFFKFYEDMSEHVGIFIRLLLKNLKSYDELITARPKYNITPVRRGEPPIVELKEEHENDFDTVQMIYLQDVDNPKSAINIILNAKDGTFQSIIDASHGINVDIPFLSFSDLRPVQYSGYFNIYDVPFNEIVFNDLVVNDESISTILTLSEITNVSVDKPLKTYIYRTPTKEQLTNIDMGNLSSPEIRFNIRTMLNDEADMAPLGVNKIIINYSRVDTADQLERFVRLMKLIMLYAANIAPEILDIYSRYIKIDDEEEVMSDQDKLVAINPKLFGRASGYAVTCDISNRPTYINMDDPVDFNNKVTNNPIIDGDNIIPRPYLTYPRGDNEVTVTCLNDKFPYVSLKPNSSSNKNVKYDYIPCCVKLRTNEGHRLAVMYQETGTIIPNQTSIDELINSRILNVGIRSRLEYTNIISMVNDYMHINPDSKLIPARIGISRSTSSFLEACNVLLYNSPTYISRKDVLSMISDGILFLSVCKQECYDMTLNEMLEELSNEELYIDSKKYYRLFEELFDINIYVFEVDANMEFQVPRHRNYHIRTNRDRGSILLIENKVSGYPQYEPIILYHEVDDELEVYAREIDSEFSDDLYQLYSLSNVNVNISEPLILTHDAQVQYQIIDQYGRLVGLVYPELTIIMNPNQPLNIPMIIDEELPEIDLIKNPLLYDAISIEYKGNTNEVLRQGVWYLDGPYNYFFPVKSKVPLDDIDYRSYPSLLTTYNDNLLEFNNSYRINRTKLNTALQLMTMLLNRYYPEEDMVPDGVIEIDSEITTFSIERIPQILPIDITWEYASTICNFITPNGTILLPDNDKLIDGVLYYLDRRLKFKLRQGNVIRDRYEFQLPERNILKFSSELSFVQWLYAMSYDVEIVDQVSTGEYKSIYPYIYKNAGLYYMIQPVYSQDGKGEYRATKVASIWRNSQMNMGYFINIGDEDNDISEFRHSQINDGLIEDLEADYIKIHGKFFAILPMDIHNSQ